MPLVLYNPPHAKTVCSPEQLAALAAAFPGLVGVKIAGDDAFYVRLHEGGAGTADVCAGPSIGSRPPPRRRRLVLERRLPATGRVHWRGESRWTRTPTAQRRLAYGSWPFRAPHLPAGGRRLLEHCARQDPGRHWWVAPIGTRGPVALRLGARRNRRSAGASGPRRAARAFLTRRAPCPYSSCRLLSTLFSAARRGRSAAWATRRGTSGRVVTTDQVLVPTTAMTVPGRLVIVVAAGIFGDGKHLAEQFAEVDLRFCDVSDPGELAQETDGVPGVVVALQPLRAAAHRGVGPKRPCYRSGRGRPRHHRPRGRGSGRRHGGQPADLRHQRGGVARRGAAAGAAAPHVRAGRLCSQRVDRARPCWLR